MADRAHRRPRRHWRSAGGTLLALILASLATSALAIGGLAVPAAARTVAADAARASATAASPAGATSVAFSPDGTLLACPLKRCPKRRRRVSASPTG